MKISAIIAAAGSGTRFKSDLPKQFVRFIDRELLLWAVETLINFNKFIEIIVSYNENFYENYKQILLKLKYPEIKLVKGANYRAVSVKNAVLNSNPASNFVLIHDAVRPFIFENDLNCLLDNIHDHDGVILANKAHETVKLVEGSGLIKKTLDRESIYLAKTPQIFRREALINAYSLLGEDITNYTDEASILEGLGYRIKVIEGSPLNIKITHPQDIVLAECVYFNIVGNFFEKKF